MSSNRRLCAPRVLHARCRAASFGSQAVCMAKAGGSGTSGRLAKPPCPCPKLCPGSYPLVSGTLKIPFPIFHRARPRAAISTTLSCDAERVGAVARGRAGHQPVSVAAFARTPAYGPADLRRHRAVQVLTQRLVARRLAYEDEVTARGSDRSADRKCSEPSNAARTCPSEHRIPDSARTSPDPQQLPKTHRRNTPTDIRPMRLPHGMRPMPDSVRAFGMPRPAERMRPVQQKDAHIGEAAAGSSLDTGGHNPIFKIQLREFEFRVSLKA